MTTCRSQKCLSSRNSDDFDAVQYPLHAPVLGMSDYDDDDEDDRRGPRERSPSYAGTRVLELLGALRSAKHAGRMKSLKKFQDYISKYKPELYDDDVELLFVGSSSLDGLIPWCGYKSNKGEDVLKTTAKSVLQVVHWLVSQKSSSDGGGDNMFLDKFLELGQEDLQRMELALHIKVASTDDNEPFELLSLLLSRRSAADGGQPDLDFDLLLPDEDARSKFTRWLQQSATEHQLMDRLQERAKAAEQPAPAAASLLLSPSGVPQHGGPLSQDAVRCLDPLGLNSMDLVSAQENTRPKVMAQASARGSSSLLAAKERINLLQKLQQAPFGGGRGGADATGTLPSKANKYTRNRSRAIRATTEAEGRDVLGASIVPQDDNFDPVLFLLIVHGASGFDDLAKGQANLEKAMGSQANQLQQLVRAHYDSFVRCADGIHWFKNMIAEEFIRPEGLGRGAKDSTKIGQLLEIVTATQEGARSLFSPLLERMDKSRGLRSARLMLQRLAKVLDVPGRMAKFMRAGQYEEVVREYERVRALPSGGGVHLLARVQEQAEVVANELRTKLMAYLAAEAHPFEDLVEAADLLTRLGGLQEPLVHCFFAQAQLLAKELDALDVWCTRSMDMVIAGGYGDLEDNDEDNTDEESTGVSERPRRSSSQIDGSIRNLGSTRSAAPMTPDGGDDESDAESYSSGEEEGAGGVGLKSTRGHAMNFSVSYVLGSTEQEASSVRLNYIRRLVKHGLRSVPTLLKLATLVSEDHANLKIVWQPGQYTYSGARVEEKGPVNRFAEAVANEVAASAAALNVTTAFAQRICEGSKRAMFGDKSAEVAGGAADADAKQCTSAKPLGPAYFREALRAVSVLYDDVFKLEAELGLILAKAVLPSLRELVEDAQRRQTQSVVDHLSMEASKLLQRSGEGQQPPDAAGRGMDGGIGQAAAATDADFAKALYLLINLSLEDLSNTLVRPFWCASQVAVGLQGILSGFLTDALSPAGPGPAGGKEGKGARALARVGSAIQLDGKYVPLIVADAQRLFEAELPGDLLRQQIVSLHDQLLQSYLDAKGSEIRSGVRSGWMLKRKSLRPDARSDGPAVPGYLVHVLLCLVRTKIEVREALDELPVLTLEDEGGLEIGSEQTYLDLVMARLAQATVESLGDEMQGLQVVLQKFRKASPGLGKVVGRVAHMAQVEVDFLLNSTLKRLLEPDQIQDVKSQISGLKRIVAEVLEDDEESDMVLEYTSEVLSKATKSYCSSLTT